MSNPRVLDPQGSYTFSKYYELNYDSEEVFAELGCSFENTELTLPVSTEPIPFVEGLSERLDFALRFTNLTSEMARREMLIAPILSAVCAHAHQKLRIEYKVDVNEQLKGSIDYFIPGSQNLLVVEAKNADISRGFTQLGAELIALDQWTQEKTPLLYGIVTTGDVWKFGLFLRTERKILKDINIYSVPSELEKLLSILLGIIQPSPVSA
ncbi:MAG: hypothetical protein AAFP03_03740 [Cyanobacteria bacterium J06598_3]